MYDHGGPKPAFHGFHKTKLPQLCDLPTAAAALGRSQRTLRRWIADGMLVSYRVKNRHLISRTELLAFLEKHRNARDVEP